MKNKLLYIGFIVILFAIGFFLARMGSEEVHLVKRSRILLGTVVEIQVRDKDRKKAETAIENSFQEITRIDNLFSTYNKNSPVWKINHSQDTIIKIDSEIFDLMVLCDSIYKLSHGAFDAGLNNLIAVWGFDGDSPALPSDKKIKVALSKSGWNKIRLTGVNSFTRPSEVGLNFGGIAKGYAVDKAIKVLKQLEINDALINAGGEIKTIGNDWTIGIQHPRGPNQVIEKIKPGKMSVATSGDYEKYFEVNGKKYHHILNPKTGYPADSLMSVTVININCTIADALSTAVFVLGPVAGINLIEQSPDTETMMIDKQMNKIYSSGFPRQR